MGNKWSVLHRPPLMNVVVTGNVMNYGRPELVAREVGPNPVWVTNWTWKNNPNLIWFLLSNLDGTATIFSGTGKNGRPFPYGRNVLPNP